MLNYCLRRFEFSLLHYVDSEVKSSCASFPHSTGVWVSGEKKESKQSQSKTPETQQARSPGSLHLRHQKSVRNSIF